MTCPNCGREPLSLAKFLLKLQVMRLECGECGARLSMPTPFKWLFSAWVLMTVLVLRFGLMSLPVPRAGFWTPRGLLLFLIEIMIPAAILATIFRLIVWRREYRCKEGRSEARAAAGM